MTKENGTNYEILLNENTILKVKIRWKTVEHVRLVEPVYPCYVRNSIFGKNASTDLCMLRKRLKCLVRNSYQKTRFRPIHNWMLFIEIIYLWATQHINTCVHGSPLQVITHVKKWNDQATNAREEKSGTMSFPRRTAASNKLIREIHRMSTLILTYTITFTITWP